MNNARPLSHADYVRLLARKDEDVALLRAVLESRPPVANMNTPGYIAFDMRCKTALRHIEERGRSL